MIYIKNYGLEALVSPMGGTVINFKAEGKEILHPWQETGGKTRGGIPICAPWFGSSPRGDKKHGHLRDLAANGHLTMKNGAQFVFYRHGDHRYPWSLQYLTEVILEDGGLTTKLRIDRPDDPTTAYPAPILPGFHPYFACQDAGGVVVRIGDKEYRGFSSNAKVVPMTSTTVFVEMEAPKRRLKMQLGGAFSPDKSNIVLWTDAPKQYVCVEPIIENKSLFESPGGRYLGAREHIELSMSLLVCV